MNANAAAGDKRGRCAVADAGVTTMSRQRAVSGGARAGLLVWIPGGLVWMVAAVLMGHGVSAQPTQRPSADKVQPGEGAQVLATFVGGQVTSADLLAAIRARPAHALPKLSTDQGKRQLLRALVDYELLVREAERRGYAEDPVVRAAVARAGADVLTSERYPVSPQAVAADALQARVATVAQAKATPELRRGTLLVLPTRTEAEQVRAAQQGKGATAFRNLARARSLHASRHSGGVLGHFDRTGQRHPARQGGTPVPAKVVEVAFATPANEISRAFALDGGFALFRAGRIRKASRPSPEVLEPELRQELAEAAQDAAVDAVVEGLRRRVGVQVFAAPLSTLGPLSATPSGILSGSPAAPRDPSAPFVAVEPDDV